MDRLEESPAVKRFTSRLARGLSSRHRQNQLKCWFDWLEEKGQPHDPDELIRIQSEASAADRFKLLDLCEEYIISLDLRFNTKKTYYSTIRSFFDHNRADLPMDPGFRIRSDEPKVKGELTLNEVKMILAKSNRTYRAIFLAMLQGGMGEHELVYWSDHGLKDTLAQLEENRSRIKIDIPGRKKYVNIRPFYTFIGRDAVTALRAYLEEKPRASSPIFITKDKTAVTERTIYHYWHKAIKRLGLIPAAPADTIKMRYGKNPHELRDLFRTRWEMSGARGMAAEFFMGHVIDPLEYNKAHSDQAFMESLYEEAERWLNIVTQEPEKVSKHELDRYKGETEGRLEAMERTLELLLSKTRLERGIE